LSARVVGYPLIGDILANILAKPVAGLAGATDIRTLCGKS